MTGKSLTLDELRALRAEAEKKAKPRSKKSGEAVTQEHLLLWMKASADPAIREMSQLIYAVPNGGSRHALEAANMKRQGVRAGVSDLVVPVARGGYFGLYLEMKAARPSNAPLQKNQQDWLLAVEKNGYCAALACGLDEAKHVISAYAAMLPTKIAAVYRADVGGSDWRSMRASETARRSRKKKNK